MNPATEQQCPECGAIIPKGADACPDCGTRLRVPPIARTGGGGGTVLKGCLIAAVVGFFGVIVIGIIAAIAIPKFANTKQKAYVAEMKTDLRNLQTAEEEYRTTHGAYQPNVAALGFTFSSGVSLAGPVDAGDSGWKATVKRESVDIQCTMSVGDRAPSPDVTGVPVCAR